MWPRCIQLCLAMAPFISGALINPVAMKEARACGLQVLVDPALSTHLRTVVWANASRPGARAADLKRDTVELVGRHIQFANAVLNKYDLLGTNLTVRLFLKRIKILDWGDCVHKGVDYCDQDVDLLAAHSSANHDDFCLSYVFTFRHSPQGYLGQAWTASPQQADAGGLCSKSSAVPDTLSSMEEDAERSDGARPAAGKQSRNTGLVNFYFNGGRVPEMVSKLSFLHEVGHSLGSQHDNVSESQWAWDRFVMHPRGGLNGFLLHNPEQASQVQLSPDSLERMASALAALDSWDRNCLEPVRTSVCGNGLVEAWEECDCGDSEEECESDPCCFPASNPEQGCQLKLHAQCSLSQGPCCSEECQWLDKEQQCSQETDCSLASFCQPQSASCPTGIAKPDSQPCGLGARICHQGQCGLSVCAKFNMLPCTPPSGNPCEVHCQLANRQHASCDASSGLHALFPEPVYYGNDALCQVMDADHSAAFGFCSVDHQCQPSTSSPMDRPSNASWIVGLAIFLICYLVVMLVALWIYCRYYRKHYVFKRPISLTADL